MARTVGNVCAGGKDYMHVQVVVGVSFGVGVGVWSWLSHAFRLNFLASNPLTFYKTPYMTLFYLVGGPTRAQRGLYRLPPAQASLFSPNFSAPVIPVAPSSPTSKKEMPQWTYLGDDGCSMLSFPLLYIAMFPSALCYYSHKIALHHT